MCTATIYNWLAKCGGMDVSMMSRMKELEDKIATIWLSVNFDFLISSP
jgi:hypothetical protein